MDDHHLAPLHAAYVTQMQRAYRVSSRGIPTPEQRRAWEADADALISAHDRETAARAWDEGYQQGRSDQADHSMYHQTHTANPHREGGADRG